MNKNNHRPEDFGIILYDKKKFEKTGVLDCFQNVDISRRSLTEIPFQFGVVDGNFECQENQLTSLKGCPTEVKGEFHCFINQLTSLEFCPSKVGGYFNCMRNQLTSLKFSPIKVNGSFCCVHNKLTSLKFSPKEVNGTFYCSHNQLTSLNDVPKFQSIELENNNFDVRYWIQILKKYPSLDYQCKIVPNNSSLEETIKGLKYKLEILKMIKLS